MPFDRVAIIGTGLIGASVGLALRAARPTAQVVGYDTSGTHAREAQRRHAIGRVEPLAEAVREAQLVVLATPVGAMHALFQELGPLLPAGAVVTDTGSTKARVLEWAQEYLPESVHFVGGHPMAGKTEAGPEAADGALFQGAIWCLSPHPRVPREPIEQVVKLVESFGAIPYFLDPDEHDGLAASVSHLPYLMSVALIGHLGAEGSWRETASLAAGGFAYATHLAQSDPTMFADIVRTNRDSIVRRLDRYISELVSLREAIAGDGGGLRERFQQAQALHRDWLAGRAQGLVPDASERLPGSRSLIAGSLLGRWGQKKP